MKKRPKNKPLRSRRTPLQEAFGKIIRKKRLSLELSQEELAELSELHFTYISSVERGERNISLENIAKIARALNSKMKDLMPD
jgi:transcriptional regulator with XRE-family HTH domain